MPTVQVRYSPWVKCLLTYPFIPDTLACRTMVVHLTVNEQVAGSSPAVPVMKKDTRTYADRREINKASVAKRRRAMKQLLVEERGGKCERCGYDKCIAALEWHHLDPSAKEGGIIGTTAGIVRQREEASKCILVCANCHRELHYEQKG